MVLHVCSISNMICLFRWCCRIVFVGNHTCIIIITCQFTNIRAGSATVYCDCNKALWNILKPNYNGITDFLVPDSDIIQEAKFIMKQVWIQIHLTWVNGHTSKVSQHTAHKLNQLAHDLAYNFLKCPHPQYIPSATVIAPPTESVQLEYGTSLITSNLCQILKHQLHTEPLITTICKEAKWTRNTFDSIDWKSFGIAFQRLPRGKQISYSKIHAELQILWPLR